MLEDQYLSWCWVMKLRLCKKNENAVDKIIHYRKRTYWYPKYHHRVETGHLR